MKRSLKILGLIAGTVIVCVAGLSIAPSDEELPLISKASAQPAKPPAMGLPWINVPDVAPIPMPPPAPGSVPRLDSDQMYVVTSQEPCFALATPPGIVLVTQEAGPLRIRGKFVGGSGLTETKTFTGKAVLVVEAAGTGRVELLVVKEGAKSLADVFRQQLDANQGPMPGPPAPTPVPPPPDPPYDPLYQRLLAAWLSEPGDKRATRNALVKVYSEARFWKGGTMAEWSQYMGNSIRAAGVAGSLLAVQRVLGDEFNATLPREPNAAYDQVKVNALLTRLAKLLEALP